jgi:hypothetical protein
MNKFVLILSMSTLYMINGSLVSASDSGDSFKKTLDGLFGNNRDPHTRQRNKETSNTITNSIFGNKVARTLTDIDRKIIVNSLEKLDQRRSHSWTNRHNNIRYKITIDSLYADNNLLCKTFIVKARINNRYENAPGDGCRVAKGRWRVKGLSVPKQNADTNSNESVNDSNEF